MSPSAIIYGCAGLTLERQEAELFKQTQPWGFILFARNLQSESQVLRLTKALRNSVAHQPHIFIDEEGGRVSRLRALGGWIGPPAASFAGFKAAEERTIAAIFANYRAIGARLASLGFTADCAPILDIPVAGADLIIGDRAFSDEPKRAAMLAQACLDGLAAAGICGVIKHIPGHGRAEVDSHKSLPVIATSADQLTATDFVPFKMLNHATMAMSAHVVYSDIDPDHPATTSKIIIEKIIRQQIGFDGLLLSDDLEMQALSGSLAERGTRAIAAGCDMLLHCSGDLAAMRQLAEITPKLTANALRRAGLAKPVLLQNPLCPQTAIAEATAILAKLAQ